MENFIFCAMTKTLKIFKEFSRRIMISVQEINAVSIQYALVFPILYFTQKGLCAVFRVWFVAIFESTIMLIIHFSYLTFFFSLTQVSPLFKGPYPGAKLPTGKIFVYADVFTVEVHHVFQYFHFIFETQELACNCPKHPATPFFCYVNWLIL